MLLIGLFALVFLLMPTEAQAGPAVIAVVAVVAVAGAAWLGAISVATAVLIAVSVALSFVSTLLRPAPKSGQNEGANAGGSAQQVENMITVREPVAVRTIVYGQRRVAGKIVFAHVNGENRFLHLVVVFAGHPVEGFHTIFLNEHPIAIDGNGMVTGGEFMGLALLKVHLGETDQGADGTIINGTGVWEATDRLRGCAYIYARFEWEPSVTNPTFGGKVYQAGVPNITVELRGKKVYDPRTATTYWTANSALCLADYLTDPQYGIGVTYDDIDEPALIAAANACDEDIPLRVGGGTGSEKRYETDGELLSSAEPQVNIGYLLGAMHGRLLYNGDKWRILAGVYINPTVAFSDDDLRAGPRVSTITSRADLFNSVKGTFHDRPSNYIKSDFPPIVSNTAIAQDGEQIWRDIDLPMTVSNTRAQRIAKIDLLLARQPIVAQMPCKLTAWQCQAGDTITWTSPRYGWSAKPFEVRKAVFAVADDGTLGVDLDLAETTSTAYDWDADADQIVVDPAPNTNFPSATKTLPPSNLRVTEELYVARDGGGVKARVVLNWDASPDAFLEQYRAVYRAVGSSIWTSLGSTDELTIDWPDAVPGTYDFGVWARNYRQVGSPLVVHRRSIAGLSAPPAAPTGLTVAAMGNVLALATWDLTPDLDVAQGGQILFRHSSLTTGATWADGVSIGQPQAANASVAWLPLKAGTYLAKYIDSTGQWSPVATFVQSQDSVLEFTGLTDGLLEEHPDFTGAKSGVAVDGGNLMLSGDADFDSVPDVDALVLFDFPGGVTSSGTYDWSTPIDLGSVKRFRLTVGITSQVVDIFDDFDSRLGDVDGWPSWDGDVEGDEADALTFVQTTDDDPGGSPAWSDWRRADSLEVVARGVKLQTRIASSDSNYNIHISALSALAEGLV